MNPYATESIPQYDFRRCCEDLQVALNDHRFLRVLYVEALRTNAPFSTPKLKEWLPKSRRKLNRLYARRTRLRRKLDAFNRSQT